MKFTPGPWRVEEGTFLVWADSDAREFDIPIVRCKREYRHWGRRMPDEEHEANVRLIAAAPDMYEALEEARQLINGDLVGVEWKRACQDFMRHSRAALAKARGEKA